MWFGGAGRRRVGNLQISTSSLSSESCSDIHEPSMLALRGC